MKVSAPTDLQGRLANAARRATVAVFKPRRRRAGPRRIPAGVRILPFPQRVSCVLDRNVLEKINKIRRSEGGSLVAGAFLDTFRSYQRRGKDTAYLESFMDGYLRRVGGGGD